MTVREAFELRKQGRIGETYDAIRPLYANDKGSYASSVMFWIATDILKKRLNEGRIDETVKIFASLERMLPNVQDKEGMLEKAFKNCQKLLERSGTHDWLAEDGPAHLILFLLSTITFSTNYP